MIAGLKRPAEVLLYSDIENFITGGENMKKLDCPACGGKIRIYYDHELGDEVYCDDCEKGYQLIGLDPIRLDWVEQYNDDCADDDSHFNDEYFDDDNFYNDGYAD